MRTLRKTNLALSFLLISLGLFAIIGRFTNSLVLIRIHPTFTSMQFNTALCFILGGASVAMLTTERKGLSIFFSVCFGLISFLTCIEYLSGFNFGIDLFFFNSPLVALTDFPGRMSLMTAFSLTLGAAMLMVLGFSRESREHLAAQYSGIFIASIGSIALLGYITGSNLLEGWSQYGRIAVHTSLGLVLLGVAVFLLSQLQLKSRSDSRNRLLNKLIETYTVILFLLIAQLLSNRNTIWLFILLGVVLFITHRRLKQSQKIADMEKLKVLRSSRLASLGTITSGIAHEVLNPLTIIQGMLQELPECANNSVKLDSKIQNMNKACNRITKIVTGLKKFSRSAEKKEYEIHPLKEIIEEAIFLTDIPAKNNRINISFECLEHSFIDCNLIEIEQVFVNLISNAIDAVKEQTTRWVKITLLEDADNVVVRVMDSGKGIPGAVQNRLYEPFFTTKAIGQGTGLGLPISKGILDDHLASIDLINNEPNTCFEIRFKKLEVDTFGA